MYATQLGSLTTVIGAGAGIAKSLFDRHPKDAGRLEANAKWLSEAQASCDPDALCALRHMSGQYGAATCGRYGAASGWATGKTQEDALVKYQQASQYCASSGTVGPAVQGGGSYGPATAGIGGGGMLPLLLIGGIALAMSRR